MYIGVEFSRAYSVKNVLLNSIESAGYNVPLFEKGQLEFANRLRPCSAPLVTLSLAVYYKTITKLASQVKVLMDIIHNHNFQN